MISSGRSQVTVSKRCNEEPHPKVFLVDDSQPSAEQSVLPALYS